MAGTWREGEGGGGKKGCGKRRGHPSDDLWKDGATGEGAAVGGAGESEPRTPKALVGIGGKGS